MRSGCKMIDKCLLTLVLSEFTGHRIASGLATSFASFYFLAMFVLPPAGFDIDGPVHADLGEVGVELVCNNQFVSVSVELPRNGNHSESERTSAVG